MTYLDLEKIALIKFVGDVFGGYPLQFVRHKFKRTVLNVLLRLKYRRVDKSVLYWTLANHFDQLQCTLIVYNINITIQFNLLFTI